MLADRMRMRSSGVKLPEGYVMAQDSDFSGTTNGGFTYIGNDEYIIIPKVIKGVTLTRYDNILNNKDILGMGCENTNVTNVENMMNGYVGYSIDLEYFNFNNVIIAPTRWTNSTTYVYYANSEYESTKVMSSMIANQYICFDKKLGYQPNQNTRHITSFNTMIGRLSESGANSPTPQYIKNFRHLDKYYSNCNAMIKGLFSTENVAKYLRIKAKIDG